MGTSKSLIELRRAKDVFSGGLGCIGQDQSTPEIYFKERRRLLNFDIETLRSPQSKSAERKPGFAPAKVASLTGRNSSVHLDNNIHFHNGESVVKSILCTPRYCQADANPS